MFIPADAYVRIFLTFFKTMSKRCMRYFVNRIILQFDNSGYWD